MDLLKHKIKILIRDLPNIKKYLRSLNKRTLLFFLKTPFIMRHICLHLNGKFYVKNDKLLLEITKYIEERNMTLIFYIETFQDILQIYEVFYMFPYSFSDIQNNYTVLDIGANIGDTALYFASYKNVDKVYAFEPFLKTYQQACDNFALNNIGGKIEIFNFGISYRDEKELKVEYSHKNTGSMTSNNSKLNKDRSKNNTEISIIELKNINYIFKHILYPPPPRAKYA
jgi:FkbM family methyltransferase